ncbi:hypothetical protein PRIPAC_81248 [Pristionchus pacificus]|uniref:Uncharacterized protein n=1 Tax=Pristionchus pacificus TaxID=54126 RepID=A0A2A6CJE1_PRIPA|nr:hypothetical protein PRIPAC_81248 [Pristionchus pacificus]|eukprot:PDM78249.1 hypothetical protein PRIPAC_30828 [Pristionchus pacificus]
MRQGTLAIFCLISTVIRSDWTTASKWWNDESAQHDCRACKAVTIDRAANCPSEGYDCEEEQPLRAFVLTEESCHCQSLACSNRDWRLAVNGSIVDRIRCERREWYTMYGETVPSAVCIRVNPDTTKSTSTSAVPTTSTTTASTDNCPAIPKLSIDECMIQVPTAICSDSIITSTSITCPLPNSKLLSITGGSANQGLAVPITCKGTTWFLPDGTALVDVQLTRPIACTSPQTTVTTSTTTEPTPDKCPALPTMTVAECMVAIRPQNLICADAIVTSTMVTCPVANSFLYFKKSATSSEAQRETCPELMKLSVADCTAVIGLQRVTCSDAIFTPTSVSCAAAGGRLVFKTSDSQTEQHDAPLTCVGAEWKMEGWPLPAALLSLPIGCVSPQTTEATSTTTEPTPDVPRVYGCDNGITPAPNACNLAFPPTISETTISCVVGFVLFIETNPVTGAPLAYPTDGEVTCVNGVWTATDGTPALNVQLNPPVLLACSL